MLPMTPSVIVVRDITCMLSFISLLQLPPMFWFSWHNSSDVKVFSCTSKYARRLLTLVGVLELCANIDYFYFSPTEYI